MYENNPAYQDYPEVTPDTGTIEEPNDHKKAVATAVGGSVVLGAAAYGLSLLDDSDSAAPVADNASAEAAAAAADARARASVPVVPVSMPAEVDKLNWPLDRLDELTFDEAFAAARHQMGPAHHFTWHEGLYNTFLQQEEANLTAAERSAFIATLPTNADSASADEPVSAPHDVHPSGGGHHHHVAPVASEPQLAETPALTPAAVAAPAITVVPLAAVADNEVTPLIDDHSSLIAEHSDNSMHHGSMTDGAIDSVDQHGHTDQDGHDDYDGMDHHHLGQ